MKNVALVLVVLSGAAQAQYKCTASNGAVTYQQAACPNTQTQRMLNARAAPAELTPMLAAPRPVPAKAAIERAAPALPREQRPKDLEQAIASIEADFERLKLVRADLEATRKLASR